MTDAMGASTTATAAPWRALQFQAWQSAPDVSFWQRLSALKLDAFQLDDQAQAISAYFMPSRSPSIPARLAVDQSSFSSADDVAARADRARYEWQAPGLLYNTNTLEDFKNLDKNAILRKTADQVLAVVEGQDAGLSVDALNSFVLLTFADLKKHSFLYWFGFPAIATPIAFQSRPPVGAATVLSASEQNAVARELMALRRVNEEGSVPLSNFPSFFVVERANGGQTISVSDFAEWRRSGAVSHDATTQRFFGFVDPCPLATNPGWPLRNFLAMLASLPSEQVPRDQPLQILAFRDHLPQVVDAADEISLHKSLVFEVKTGEDFVLAKDAIKVVGWESNARGKMGPRIMELAGILDPLRLAEQSVDLNLKLMLWRQLPTLQLETLASTKCLVLGAGTLGCFTARNLLAWGFRQMTLVDNSVVSHSNPVRQPLFEFQDVGKPKAECAVAALKRIFPLVNATAVHLSIPMAGHPLSSVHLVQDAQRSLTQLSELIDAHDVIILGTDSRESRWLPTVMCAAKGKILLNAALGFDGYLVMRHGVGAEAPGLGCYFCNDVVGPRDSLKDRTLDQMCTVTRPGLAPIAAATAVELLVALLHSPDGVRTSADVPDDRASPLGYVPHQLRGFLNAFSSMCIKGEAFDKCIACSAPVLEAYRAAPFELLQNACNSSTYLEELTGLHLLTEAAESFMDELEDSDEDPDALL